MLTSKDYRFLRICKEVADLSKGVGGARGDNFRIGCVIVGPGGCIVSTGVNSYKTSPRLSKFYDYPYYHAEAHAILRRGVDTCNGCTMYVVRVTRRASLAIAKPCKECQRLIKEAKIKKVIYSCGNNSYESL